MFRLILILSAVFITSCGMKKDMEETHDATQAVEKTSDEIYSDNRQGVSAEGRRQAWNSLLAAKSPQNKLIYAAHFVRSFDVQMWSGVAHDSKASRMELAKKNAEEFMLMLQGLIKPGQIENMQPIPFADAMTNPFWGNRIKSFNAISTVLQEMDPKQRRVARTNNLTFLSMVQEALKASFERKLGQSVEKYPDYVHEILRHERVAVLLMQTRMNYSAVLALGKISEICNGGTAFLRMRFASWNLSLEDKGTDELILAAEKMNDANKTYEFLRSVGITPVLNGPLATVMGGMRITDKLRNQYQRYQQLNAQRVTEKRDLNDVESQSRPVVEIGFVREYVDFIQAAKIQMRPN